MRPLLASYKEVPPGIIFSTKEKCLDDLTKCSSRKTSVTGQFIASWRLTRPVLTSPSTRKLNSTREVLWSRGWDSDCYNQAREKVQDAKGSSRPPPPRPPPPVPPPPQNKTVLVKNVPPSSNYFYSEIHCKCKRDLFCRKLRHSEIKSSRLRDRKKRTITGQSCRISKIYRDLDNSLRLFSAYENKRGMGEGPHPVDYRLGGAILLLILD